MNNILEVKGLQKKFETFALKDVAFAIPEGYIMGFIGPNGAGKTTTIKSILNMVHYEAGSIQVFGLDAIKDSAEINQEIGVVMDLPFYVEDWNAKDVAAALAPFYREWDDERYREFLDQFKIDAKKKVRELSRGMKVKLMIAVALSHNAKLLILDEPTSGLDPAARDELLDILHEYMADERRSILFSTHITSDLEKIADYITFIKNGEIIFTGFKDTLIEGYVIVKGGQEDITSKEKPYILGLREHSSGFEGMVALENLPRLSPKVHTEPVSLDEIIVYINREG